MSDNNDDTTNTHTHKQTTNTQTDEGTSGDTQDNSQTPINTQSQINLHDIMAMMINMQETINKNMNKNTEDLRTETKKNTEETNKNLEILSIKSDTTNKNLEDLRTETKKNTEETNKNFERLEQNIEKIEVNLNKKMEEFTQETRRNIQQQEEKIATIEEKQKIQEQQVITNLNKIEINLQQRVTELCQQVTEKMAPVNEEIQDIRQKMNRQTTTEKINVVINPNLFRTEPDRKYFGDYKINPKIFLKTLKMQVENLDPSMDIKKYIRSTLGGDAELWYDIIYEEFETYEQFSRMFLQYFWGDQNQSKVRENLFHGKYNENFLITREKYAMRKFSIAKQLDPPMSEGDIIKYIARHYETEISDVIAIHEINDIERLLEYLKRIDDVKKTHQRINKEYSQKNRQSYNTNYIRRDGGSANQNIRLENNYYKGNNENNYTRRDGHRTYNNSRFENNWNNGNYNRYNRDNYDTSNKKDERKQDRENTSRKEEENKDTRRYTRSPTRNQRQYNGQDNNQARKNVQFEEIAMVHDAPRNQNFCQKNTYTKNAQKMILITQIYHLYQLKLKT